MAAVTRQPFATLDGARLQSLTSLKNRQNVISPASSGKRKAALLDTDDFENVDPLLFAKRPKGFSSATPSRDSLKKASSFILTKTPSTLTPLLSTSQPKTGQIKASSSTSSIPRRALHPKSPIAKLGALNALNAAAPKSAPAGRSPTHPRRSGILSNRRRTTRPCTRIDSPSFSLDAALKGTISSYGSRPASAKKPVPSSLLESEAKASWFFDIHEDTPEQEMTNLLQHGTCVLDISSDEETQQRARRDGAEGRDKENIPPVDDVSQTSARAATSANEDDMVVEKKRVALGEMNAADFYPEGCDETSVIIIPADDVPKQTPVLDDKPEASIDALIMATSNGASSKAAVLQPIEGTGDSFELWESGSATDDTEPAAEKSS